MPRSPAPSCLPLCLVLLPALAWGFQIEDPLHPGCHERLTHQVLQAVGYVAPPPALTGEDARLPGALQFDVSPYEANVYAWSLLEGVRYPDLYGAASFDFLSLATVHNAPGDQGEHCLRSAGQDGAGEADAAALAGCRAAIERFYWAALATLDEAGRVDPSVREPLAINVVGAGEVAYPLSGFYVNAGRALHAVQDSFTHTYRGEDWRTVRHVFNWVDQVRCTLDEARDGHGHEGVLDNCEGTHPSNAARLEATRVASEQLLRALSEPGPRAERQQRLERFFQDWLRQEEGCALANGYCASAEHTWLASSELSDKAVCAGGCAAAPGAAHGGWVALAVGVLALGAVRARRLRWTGAVLAGVLALAPGVARAREAQPAASGPRLLEGGWRAEVRASGSVMRPALALGVAGKWAWRRAEVGVFAEFNPWLSVERGQVSLGSTNVGALVNYLLPVSERVRLRMGLGLGVSVLNQELIGSDAGTRGVYLNLRLLGLEWALSDRLALTVDGFDLALAAPQLVGWPVLYSQQRFSVGLQF